MAVDLVFEYWLEFRDGIRGKERGFRLRHSVGKELVAGKAGTWRDVGALS